MGRGYGLGRRMKEKKRRLGGDIFVVAGILDLVMWNGISLACCWVLGRVSC